MLDEKFFKELYIFNACRGVKHYPGRELVQWIHECTDFSGQKVQLDNLI